MNALYYTLPTLYYYTSIVMVFSNLCRLYHQWSISDAMRRKRSSTERETKFSVQYAASELVLVPRRYY